MKKLRELLRLFRLFLVTAIERWDTKKDLKVAGRQTDFPVASILSSDFGKTIYYDIIKIFYLYSGKLGHFMPLEKGYDGDKFTKGLLKVFEQKYMYEDIEKIRANGGGVMCISSEMKCESSLKPVGHQGQVILAVYIDEFSITPDILIRMFKTHVNKLNVTGIELCGNSRSASFARVNIAPVCTAAEIKIVEMIQREKETV